MFEFTLPEEALVRHRRWFHAHPELSYKEFDTTNYIVKALEAIGVDSIERPCETGVVATVVGRAGPGPCVALRSDIDALPVKEASGLPFASENEGVSHVCGHDAHMAMLLAAAQVLTENRERFAGTVKLLFQHAEEVPPGGAVAFVKAGVLDGVKACIGLHVVNDPVGLLRVCTDRCCTSACDSVFITIHGKGTHGSMPHMGVDPVLTGSQIVCALQSIVARNVSPEHFAVVSPTIFEAPGTINVVPNSARIGVNLRSRDEKDRELLRRRVEEVARGCAAAQGAEVEFEWIVSYGSVLQDLTLVEKARETAREVLGEAMVGEIRALTASEDFSVYSEVVPSVFMTLGAGDAACGRPYANHHPKFDVDEACLTNGVKVEVALALKLLAEG